MEKRLNILWLVSWYPNRDDQFAGDFIQRHARAAAAHHNIHVLYVGESESDDRSLKSQAGLIEQLVYFKKTRALFNKVRKHILYRRVLIKEVEQYIDKYGKPSYVHVQVPWKAGLVALYLQKKYGLEYLVTEHWGIYNYVVDDNFYYKPAIVRNMLRKIFGKSKKIVSVSEYLGEQINKIVVKKEFAVIPNITDSSLFFLQKEKHAKFTYIHVSNMVPLKNVKGLLDAFQKLLNTYHIDVQLIMVGNKEDEYVNYAASLGLLNRSVFFKGEIAYEQVAKEMRSAHCLVLNSDIENAPCVIGEALCCGLPVVATGVGGIPEMIDRSNGWFFPSGNKDELMKSMKMIFDKYASYDQEAIAVAAQNKYGTAVITQKFRELYQS